MANLRAIRTRIKSVESTRQITKSMKMVAAAKLRKNQEALGGMRAFAEESRRILSEVIPGAGESGNPLLTPRGENRRVCYVLIVGNRGLCGTYNQGLLRYLEELAEGETREKFLVVCGRWGKDQIPGTGLEIRRSFEISDTPQATEAHTLAAYLRELYLSGQADEILLVYQLYKSALQQVPGTRSLLPLARPESREREGHWLFEPDREAVLAALVDMVIDNTVHAALMEARTGEHTARMTAMTSASDNTEELIGKLRLQLNHARQAIITTEISEIAGGAEALKNKK